MQCKQAHEYAHIKCNQSKFMSLLPLLVCLSCLRILILSHPSMLLPLCPCPCPTSTSLSQSRPKLSYVCTSLPKLSYLYTISSPLSPVSIKDVLLIDAKSCIWGRWLRLESYIFYGHHYICWNDSIWIALGIPHIGSLTLIPIGGAPPPMS